jgi:ElaB/YqjD/DUF883 family membrane-anchored ribosome-binding protein
MTAIARHFDDRKREHLAKLFRALGSDNAHEADAARGRIDSLLREFGKTWADIIQLLSGTAAVLRADLASDIASLGSSDPDERVNARRNIADLLARHRKNWNDLANVLDAASNEAWACDPSADDPQRVNDLLGLIINLLEEYMELRPHEYVAVALWVLHSHVYDRFMQTPRLVLRSPVANVGKTTLFSVQEKLTARGKKYDAITTAAIIRRIDQQHPTVLIDEADNLGLELRENGRLRAVFNSGHRKGGIVSMVECGREREYSTFAPLALALPDTLAVYRVR